MQQLINNLMTQTIITSVDEVAGVMARFPHSPSMKTLRPKHSAVRFAEQFGSNVINEDAKTIISCDDGAVIITVGRVQIKRVAKQ